MFWKKKKIISVNDFEAKKKLILCFSKKFSIFFFFFDIKCSIVLLVHRQSWKMMAWNSESFEFEGAREPAWSKILACRSPAFHYKGWIRAWWESEGTSSNALWIDGCKEWQSKKMGGDWIQMTWITSVERVQRNGNKLLQLHVLLM